MDDLSALRFGVRVDKEGHLLHDYHTVQMYSGKTYVTHRYYLSDATFLVGLESENEELLKEIKEAILPSGVSAFFRETIMCSVTAYCCRNQENMSY